MGDNQVYVADAGTDRSMALTVKPHTWGADTSDLGGPFDVVVACGKGCQALLLFRLCLTMTLAGMSRLVLCACQASDRFFLLRQFSKHQPTACV